MPLHKSCSSSSVLSRGVEGSSWRSLWIKFIASFWPRRPCGKQIACTWFCHNRSSWKEIQPDYQTKINYYTPTCLASWSWRAGSVLVTAWPDYGGGNLGGGKLDHSSFSSRWLVIWCDRISTITTINPPTNQPFLSTRNGQVITEKVETLSFTFQYPANVIFERRAFERLSPLHWPIDVDKELRGILSLLGFAWIQPQDIHKELPSILTGSNVNRC